ncbi:hypothetical protein DXO181_20525, partial [Xanthomonas oryzae pv. oryzae]
MRISGRHHYRFCMQCRAPQHADQQAGDRRQLQRGGQAHFPGKAVQQRKHRLEHDHLPDQRQR